MCFFLFNVFLLLVVHRFSLLFCMFLSFSYVFFSVFSAFFGFSSVFLVFFCMFLLLSFLVFYSVFNLLFFLYFPFILLPFLLGFQCFLRFCGLFLSIRYTFCIVVLYSVYIAASQIASVSSVLVSLHFAFVSCNFEIFFFQLAICWSHFAVFRAGFTHI